MYVLVIRSWACYWFLSLVCWQWKLITFLLFKTSLQIHCILTIRIKYINLLVYFRKFVIQEFYNQSQWHSRSRLPIFNGSLCHWNPSNFYSSRIHPNHSCHPVRWDFLLKWIKISIFWRAIKGITDGRKSLALGQNTKSMLIKEARVFYWHQVE